MSLTPKPIEIFISYSHKDQGLRDQLETHLSLLKRQRLISSWHDRKIGAGEEWAGQIDAHLHTAQIILLLVSPDFMVSDYCYDIEMRQALARHDAGEARVIPIVLRPVDWRSPQLAKLQALPQDAKPVTTWQNQDEAFLDIARGIRNVVEQQSTKSPTTTAANPPATHRSILGFPPPTDPRTIQQRETVVKDVYAKLTQPGITAIVLTGIGGLGKSTLAALVHRYAEEQRRVGNGPFIAEALWLTVDPAVTLVNLAGTLFDALSKSLPEFTNLPPINQAAALHNALSSVDKPRLIILDQFENLLDWQTGQALPDKPGIGEWLDAINSQPGTCRILLSSRPWPQGTRAYPPTCMQEYPVLGLDTTEGISLLRKQGVEAAQANYADLQQAVVRCAGHALALTLLASILRSNRSLSLNILFNDPFYASLWTGNIARSLLDYIHTYQLSEAQRRLLQAFSVYREPVALDAAQAIIPEIAKVQILPALNVLLNQHLLNAVGNGLYQLHAIVASYAQSHFDDSHEQANQKALRAAHGKAAQYYFQRAAQISPPREKRRGTSDVQPLIEATWHYCQADQWHEAYELMEQENLFSNLNLWGGNTILLELCLVLLPLDKWNPKHPQAARIYNYLGRVYKVLGVTDRALKYLDLALTMYNQIEDQRGEALTLINLGEVYSAIWNKEQALNCYDQALGIYKAIGDRQGEGEALNNMGAVQSALGRRTRAREYYEQALALRREVGDREGEGRTLNNLGWIYNTLGQKNQAVGYLEQALSIRREVGDRRGEGITLGIMAMIYSTLGLEERSVDYHQQAARIQKELNGLEEGETSGNDLDMSYLS